MATENATPLRTAKGSIALPYFELEIGGRFTDVALICEHGDAETVEELRRKSREVRDAAAMCTSLVHEAAASGQEVRQLLGASLGIEALLGVAAMFDQAASDLARGLA